ncbi:bacteriohemerythrin [Inconstantimicrobium mannanitabidum]|uniref:Uncharacterized protein n=1 Tax=Inconstantimicrobium mannanitabidum TaxID=1604901 RepID=A0ACB5RCD9_9CLOT|nr:hemerythrin family protein [Clostridium sp. TW13]GKX66837.1 hypothetical protein rsdtw13_20950 [Clostridium sp. TW13]
MIIWDDSFSTGIEIIDQQHKYLFSLSRKLEILLETPIGVDKKEDAIMLLCDFRNFVTFHFYFEENYLKDLNSSDFYEHTNEHTLFINKLTDIDITNFSNEDYNELKTFLNTLYGYILTHIKERDTKLKMLIYN